MNKKSIFPWIITIIIGLIIIISSFRENTFIGANTVYQVYLDGVKLGLIADEDELYDLINEEQKEIREKFGVDKVYPPNGFSVNKYRTFNESITPVEQIYAQIKDEKPFTVIGTEFTILDEETNERKTIYVLDENVFDGAIRKVISAFISATTFEKYLSNTQEAIVDVGSIIENIEFGSKVTKKEVNIAIDETIYTDIDELAKYLLFGTDAQIETYTVKSGDSIETIAFENQLNAGEFLLANSQLTSENIILGVGEEVYIALVEPIIPIVYDVYKVEDEEVNFETEYTYDYTKSSSYREVTQKGETGVLRVASRMQFVNGTENQEGSIDNDASTYVKNPVTEKVTIGRRASMGTPVTTTGLWGWPTNKPYMITSSFGWRRGTFHTAVDISGVGYRSPAYAPLDGVVLNSGRGGPGGSACGINVVLDHNNGYQTMYCHLAEALVSVGQTVTKGQRIGLIGNTGTVSPRPTAAYPTRGTHLHFSVYKGEIRTGTPINPLSLYPTR